MAIIKYILFCLHINAQYNTDFLQTARSDWYKPEHMPIVGLEVELTNMAQEKVSAYLQQTLGGYILVEQKKFTGLNSTGFAIEWNVLVYKHKGTRIGSFAVELDENGVGGKTLKPENAVVEIVTRPLNADAVEIFSDAILDLQTKGAKGVDSQKPVAIQLNLQVGDGSRESIDVLKLLSFLRNYFSSSHRYALKKYFSVPENRQKYIGDYSPGMLKRILDVNYRPSPKQFYDDFLYRQTLELFGNVDAWNLDIETVKHLVKEQIAITGIYGLLPVVKWNYIRLSSLLTFLFPEEWMSKFLLDSKWVKALPLIEIREPNSDFRLFDYYQTLGGLFIKSFSDGSFVFLEKENGILKRDLDKISELQKKAGDGIFIIRTMLFDGVSDPYQSDLEKYLPKYDREGSTVIFLNGKEIPQQPLLVAGESVVFHNLPELSGIIMGKYNPALANQHIGSFIQHKHYEYLFWNDYAPDAMPKTFSLADILTTNMTPAALQERLNALFPKGWVLKGAFESATQKQFVFSNDHDLEKEHSIYSAKSLEFQALREKALLESKGNNPDILARTIREHEAFTGWRLKRYMKKPLDAIVQERISISSEYRVEAIAGKVLGGESTIPRYQYQVPDDNDWKNTLEIKRIENFVQGLLDRLPADLRATPFAFDIAVSMNGDIRLIESNPMSNSGFLIYDKRGIKELNKFLKNYPELLQSGAISEGMSTEKQLEYIRAYIQKHKLNVDFMRFPFLQQHTQRTVPLTDGSNTSTVRTCKEIFYVR